MRGLVGIGFVLAGGCATDRWERLQAEFADVRANCELAGTVLQRDSRDRRLLHLVFRQRNAEEIAAARDGRLACVRHWAGERGYRLTVASENGSPR